MKENNKQDLKYGKLTANKSKAIPWDILLVYLIGPYKIRREINYEQLIIKALTMIDPETGWFEKVQYNNKQAATIEKLVDQKWYIDTHALQ